MDVFRDHFCGNLGGRCRRHADAETDRTSEAGRYWCNKLSTYERTYISTVLLVDREGVYLRPESKEVVDTGRAKWLLAIQGEVEEPEIIAI